MQPQKLALLQQPNRIDKYLRALLFNTDWLTFCLCIFILSRFILLQQLSWVNSLDALNMAPADWLRHFDSFWYENILTEGYTTKFNYVHHANYVFFPLLPLCTFIFKEFTHLPIAIAGQVFSNLCFFGSLLLFYQYLKFLLADEIIARFGVILLAFSPFNIYFASFYTESLFLLLSLATMLAAYHQRWWLSAFIGMLMTSARPNGIMILLPLGVMALTQYYQKKIPLRTCLSLALIPLGLIAYMTYLHFKIGDALGFFHNEIYWYRPGVHIDSFLNRPTYFHIISPYNTFIFIINFFLIYELLRKNFFYEFLYFLAILLPSILSSSPISMARYSACLYTFYLALILYSYHKKYLMFGLLFLEALYFGIYVSGWIHNAYAFM
jgi:Gpi18-like mannosyltransferase